MVQVTQNVVHPTTDRGATSDQNMVQPLPTNPQSESSKNPPLTDGHALTRTTAPCGNAEANKTPDPEPGKPPNGRPLKATDPLVDGKNPEGLRVGKTRTGHTVENGLKFIEQRLRHPDCIGLSHALAEAQSLGYPVSEAQAREHVAARPPHERT